MSIIKKIIFSGKILKIFTENEIDIENRSNLAQPWDDEFYVKLNTELTQPFIFSFILIQIKKLFTLFRKKVCRK